ncbi:MAG: hypothetical protein IJU71_03115, partial [Selenomonadaceae bacterium]|nr:hypothetical protein [Selenomonadaceae bacterium]
IGSSGNDIIIAGGYDTVDGNGGNDLIVIEDGSSTVETGTLTDPNSGFEYTTVTGSIYEDNHTQQVIGIATVGTSTVIGFETGWESDEGDPDLIFADNLTVLTFDFDDNGLIVNDGAGSLILAADVFSTVADLLINDTKARVINDNQTVEATDADRYYLPQGSVLTNVTGTVDIDDCRFSTSGNLTVNGGTYSGADGTEYYFAASAYGLRAGDTISIGDLWSDPDTAKVYRVSDDGSQIIRVEDGAVVYEGDGSTIGSVNFGQISFADYYGSQIATAVGTFIDKYITFDGDELIINADQLQSDLRSGIESYQADLETANADVAVQRLSFVLDNMLGINVALDQLLSETVIDNMKSRISTAIDNGSTAFDALISDLDQYEGGVGLRNWLIAHVTTPMQAQLGLQGFAKAFADIVDGEGNLHLGRWLVNAQPLLSDLFSDDLTSKVLTTAIDSIGNDLLDKIRADSGGTLDGHADIIFNGDDSVGLGIFLTPIDVVGSTVGNTIDASGSTIENNIIVSNLNDSLGEAIIGSSGRDMIMIGEGDTVNGMGGGDLIIFADDGDHIRQVLELDTLSAATIVGFETGWESEEGETDLLTVDAYSFYELQFKVDFSTDGMTITDSDGSLFFADVNSTVSTDLLINDQRVTAVNRNQSVDATGADRYLLCDAATLANFTGKAIVNDITFSVTSPVSIVALERANRGNRIVNGIFGVSANDTVKLANSDGANEITYVVNADGT